MDIKYSTGELFKCFIKTNSQLNEIKIKKRRFSEVGPNNHIPENLQEVPSPSFQGQHAFAQLDFFTFSAQLQFQTQRLRTTAAVSSCRKLTLTWKWTLRWVQTLFSVAGCWGFNPNRTPALTFQFQKAEAQLAYELQAAKIQQRIRQEEIQIQVKIVPFYATNNNFS